MQANQDLQGAVARVDQARETARVSKADLFPYVSLDPAIIASVIHPTSSPASNITATTSPRPWI